MVYDRNIFFLLFFMMPLIHAEESGCQGVESQPFRDEYYTYVLPKQMQSALRKGLKATSFSKRKRKAIIEYVTEKEHNPSVVYFLSSYEYEQIQALRALFWQTHTQPIDIRILTTHFFADCTQAVKKSGMKKTIMAVLKCIHKSKAFAETVH